MLRAFLLARVFSAPVAFGLQAFAGESEPLPPDYYTPRNPTVTFPDAVTPTVSFQP